MEKHFTFTRQHRLNIQAILESTPEDKLYSVPQGFNNSIWWNIAHLVVTQQLLTYHFAGLQMLVPDDVVASYRKGTAPTGTPSTEAVALIKSLLVKSIDQTQMDYEKGLFKDYREYTTSAKVTLKCIEDGIAYNLYHEGIHLGSILALLRVR